MDLTYCPWEDANKIALDICKSINTQLRDDPDVASAFTVGHKAVLDENEKLAVLRNISSADRIEFKDFSLGTA